MWFLLFLKVGFDCFDEYGMWVLMATMFWSSCGGCVGDGLVRVKYETSSWSGEVLEV